MKDYNYDFFGHKTLEKTYLYRIDKKIIERPQDLLMRYHYLFIEIILKKH